MYLFNRFLNTYCKIKHIFIEFPHFAKIELLTNYTIWMELSDHQERQYI